MTERYCYCGWVLASEIPFPELTSAPPQALADVAIRCAAVSNRGIAEVARGPNWAVAPDAALWWVDGLVRFRIEPDRITVDAVPGADFDAIRALLLESAFVLAALLRGEFLLRAAAVADRKGVIALIGPAGGGKSTLAATLVGQGYRLMSDSLLRITGTGSGQCLAWPQGSGLLLWPKSVTRLGLAQHPQRPLRRGLALKRLLWGGATSSAPLVTVYTGVKHTAYRWSDAAEIEVTGRQDFATAASRTAGRLWVEPAGRTKEHFAWCLTLANSCVWSTLPKKYTRDTSS